MASRNVRASWSAGNELAESEHVTWWQLMGARQAAPEVAGPQR